MTSSLYLNSLRLKLQMLVLEPKRGVELMVVKNLIIQQVAVRKMLLYVKDTGPFHTE